LITVPGRVNLIGEHIDYHGLPVLPIAIGRSIHLNFSPRSDHKISAESAPYGRRNFEWTTTLVPAPPGDWENYLRAAAATVASRWGVGNGIDAVVTSDLPPAAGLSSSTALMTAVVLALLRANGIAATFEELMQVLPEGEHFTGTRGGGMDHAAVLGSHAGCASLIEFAPFSLRPVPIPKGWAFIAAHSMVTAEKSGDVRERYNAAKQAGASAIQAINAGAGLSHLSLSERDAFIHVTGEAARVREAVLALERADAATFGSLLIDSHASLRDRLHVSCPALDRVVEAALEGGALGARLTGAGFGGFAVVFCAEEDRARVRRCLIERYYSMLPDFREERDLLDAVPSAGVLQQGEHATPHN